MAQQPVILHGQSDASWTQYSNSVKQQDDPYLRHRRGTEAAPDRRGPGLRPICRSGLAPNAPEQQEAASVGQLTAVPGSYSWARALNAGPGFDMMGSYRSGAVHCYSCRTRRLRTGMVAMRAIERAGARSAKSLIFRFIREFHRRWHLRDDLPARVAIYLHSVEPGEHNALKGMLRWLRALEYQFVSPHDFAAPFAVRGRLAFLSFDDNFRAWLDLLPVFEGERVSATFYVNSEPLRDRAGAAEIGAYFDRIRHTGERVPLSSSELLEIAAAGHVIGSHTYSHALLTSLPHAHALQEIRAGKEALEDILGGEVADFSYPYGMRRHFNEKLRADCGGLGIKTVASARPIPHAAPVPLSIHRILWRLNRPMSENVENLYIDGRFFEWLTGRSPVGD
jgi:peptidoglycan/xylan/chitin deacetylase (PgdA/CDA1 family)